MAERRRGRILLRNIISGGAGGEASKRLRDQDVPFHQPPGAGSRSAERSVGLMWLSAMISCNLTSLSARLG